MSRVLDFGRYILEKQLQNTAQELKRASIGLEEARNRQLNPGRDSAYEAITESTQQIERYVERALRNDARKKKQIRRRSGRTELRPGLPVETPAPQPRRRRSGRTKPRPDSRVRASTSQPPKSIPKEPVTREESRYSRFEKRRENTARHKVRGETSEGKRPRNCSTQRSPPPSSPREPSKSRKIGSPITSEHGDGEVSIVKSEEAIDLSNRAENHMDFPDKDFLDERGDDGLQPRPLVVYRPNPQDLHREETEHQDKDTDTSKKAESCPSPSSSRGIANEHKSPEEESSKSDHARSPQMDASERSKSRDSSSGPWRAMPPFGSEGDRKRPRKRRSPSPIR